MGNKWFKNGIVGSVCILLAAIVIPSTVAFAETVEISPTIMPGEEQPYLVEPEEGEDTNEEPTEIIEERTENEVVTDNHDGTFTKKIYQDPVYKEDEETGELLKIDTTLEKQEEEIVPNNTEIQTRFFQKMDQGTYQIVGSEKEAIVFALKGASSANDLDQTSSEESVDSEKNHESSEEDQRGETIDNLVVDRTVELNENEAVYKDVLPKVDFRQTIFNQSIKEDLILNEVNNNHTYYFQIETALHPTVEETGEVTFKNEENEIIYEIPRPMMEDSNIDEQLGAGNTSENLSFDIIHQSGNIYQLALRVDSEWIQNENRVFPIYIDPSITYNKLQDGNARQANPGINYSGSTLWRPQLKAHTLWVGKYQDTQINQAYFKTDMSKIDQATIQKAQFKVYNIWHSYDNLSNEISLNAVNSTWDAKKITWNNKPTHTYITKTNVKKNQWATFDVTGLVQDWSTGKRANNGISLTTKNQDDHWKQVVASENATNVPYFEITYAYNKPAKPTVKGVAHNNQKTGHLEISWPKVAGATSYQVTLSSGKEDLAFPVGNVTSFSTKGKGIFPTDQEVQDGAYRFHTDGKGTDLALDPREFYENVDTAGATSSLKGMSGYDVRVAAVYPGGTSPRSDFVRTYIPIGEPKVPNAKAYANLSQEESGYVSLNWSAVPLADGYEVLIFNGKDYQAFDVGNTFKWTTQGKGIWPTKAEIEKGGFLLHADGKGEELAKDPRPVYKNAGTQYAERTNYWFRIKAYRKDNKHAKSSWSAATMPSLPDSQADKLGMADFWTSVPVRGGQVNAMNGNFILTEQDFELTGRGYSIQLQRNYNSFNQTNGLFGNGWSSSFEEYLLEDEKTKNIYWTESDGKQHLFKKNSGGYETPPGLYSQIKKESDNTFTKIEEDKSTTIYSATGKKIKEIDKNKNTTIYSYDDKNRLIKVEDASGRIIQLTYQENDLVEKIVLPNQTTLTYKYDSSGRLIESKSARGKTYGYGYNDQGQLVSLKEPKNTKEQPQETKYSYEGQKLIEILDPVQKKTSLSYDSVNRTATLTNERGKKTAYTYSKAGNPEKMVEDTEGLKLTTTYVYESNNLIKETNPKGQAETYTYDSEGNILTFTDAYGTETYEYNKNNDVISETDTENRTSTIAYDGADALSETIEDANTSSFTLYDSFGNPLKESASLGTGENLVENSGFETGNTESWYLSQDTSRAKGSAVVDSSQRAPGSLSGKHSIKINSYPANTDRKTHSSTAIAQRFDVEPNTTYTLSADIKAANMKDSQAFLDVWLIQADNKTGEGWRNNRETAIKGNTDWVRRQITFTTTKNTHRIGIYLKNEQLANKSGSADVWFDNIQLERGSIHTGYNPVLNSGLEEAKDKQDITHFSLYGNKTGIGLSEESFTGNQGFKMTRKTFSETNGYISQHVQLNQQKAAPITISGLSKAENVQSKDSSSAHIDYSLWADLIYQDGSIEYVHEKFPTGTQEWNRAVIAVQPKKAIKEVKLLFMFRNNVTGTAYFDNLRIMEGNRLTEKVYDSNGNYVLTQFDEERRKVSFTYDILGNVLSETDEKGQQKTFQYNEDNQLVGTKLANGTEVNYTYDANGNIEKREIKGDTQSQIHEYQYDADDKVTSYQDSLGRKILYAYDANGNQTSVEMPNGHTVKNEYDSADRQSKVLWGDQVAYSFQYDPNGNQTKVTDHLNQTTIDKVYDDADRITAVQERGGSIAYQYKDKPTKENKGKTDKVSTVTVSKDSYTRKVSYDYDALDRNTAVQDGENRYRFDYDEFDNISLYTAGNGAMTNFNYDQTNKLTELAIGTANQQQIVKESYIYDETGNRASITHTDGKQSNYIYDSVNQLTSETLPNGETRTYSYDGFGNRVGMTINGQTTAATFNTGNQLTKFKDSVLTYDANGNRLTDGKYSYTWDASDHLIGVTKKGESTPFVTYTYDANDRRVSKTLNGEKINYHYDGDSIYVLYETNLSGTVIRQYIYSDDNVRLAMKSGSETLYYHYNGHGDVIALTDNQGNLVASYTYDAWGNIISNETKTELAKQNPFKYAGYMYDEEIQQYYLMARYYHPEQGVFLSVDPYPGDEDDPLTMNGYAYVGNNPVMNIDPDGNFVLTASAAAAYGLYSIGLVALGGYFTYRVTRPKSYYSTYMPKRTYNRSSGYSRYKGSKITYRRKPIPLPKIKINNFSSPLNRPNRKKQGREVNGKNRTKKNFKSRSNKNPNRDMKKHTPSKRHKGGK